MTRPDLDSLRAAAHLIALLTASGETGWTEAPTSNPAHGRLVLWRGTEIIRFSYRFNTGDPAWFCSECPERLQGSDMLNPIRMRGGV